jgi:hypothetical protein
MVNQMRPLEAAGIPVLKGIKGKPRDEFSHTKFTKT